MQYNKIFAVDLYSGSYVQDYIGHEKFNLVSNKIDGKYYGYAPPSGNISIERIDPQAKDFATGVLVVYVAAISQDNKNREIIAFCKNATVFRKEQLLENSSRSFVDNDNVEVNASFHIVSNNLTDLRGLPNKFVIDLSKYNPYMFRSQRSFLDMPKYVKLRQNIIDYILNEEFLTSEEDKEQASIYVTSPASERYSKKHGENDDEIVQISASTQVKKNPAIAKKVLKDNNYKCFVDSSHTTFITPSGVPYMEGHHLIPCTVDNSSKYKGLSKLDREENIVSLCPTCHRAVHYGNADKKQKILAILYEKQKNKLSSVNLAIKKEELFNLYS